MVIYKIIAKNGSPGAEETSFTNAGCSVGGGYITHLPDVNSLDFSEVDRHAGFLLTNASMLRNPMGM